MWYQGDYLPHFALVEVCHAGFAVWLLLLVTARVARDDMRARTFSPLALADGLVEGEELERQGVQMEVFQTVAAASQTVAASQASVNENSNNDFDEEKPRVAVSDVAEL